MGREAVALLAVLSLWLQVLVPVVGGTAQLVLAESHADAHHGATHENHAHHDEPSPAAPATGHDHRGLCCIVGGGKLGFAPPPCADHFVKEFAAFAVAVAYRAPVTPRAEDRALLPVGARAPPRLA
jgi:hypothetical protein